MPRWLARLALAFACGVVLAACGSESGGGGPADANDKRGAALACLRGEKKLAARPMGKDAIAVGDAGTGPRIRFFLTGGEAEAAQFEGREEGTEQIGSALLYVRKAPEGLLDEVEACLEDL